MPVTRNLSAETSPASRDGLTCSLLPKAPDPGSIKEAMYERLEDAGCPLAPSIRDRIRFETLLADLSAMFVNVHPDQVDAQIIVGLQHIVEFLGIDRSGLGQLLPGESNIAITAQHPPRVRSYKCRARARLASLFCQRFFGTFHQHQGQVTLGANPRPSL